MLAAHLHYIPTLTTAGYDHMTKFSPMEYEYKW